MKLLQVTATGVLLFGLMGAVTAAPPPLDRPTPPPCCADGHCFANSVTYGWYETRWRRWPCECGEAIPGGQLTPATPPTPRPGELPAYDVPTAEEEDRRAPLPTAPRGEDQSIRGPATNGPAGPGASPSSGAPGQPGAQPPVGPFGPLGKPAGESTTPRRSGLPAYEPRGAGSESIHTTPSGPSSELDPPPALPFGTPAIIQPSPIREANQRPTAPVRQTAPAAAAVPGDDPPPSLPAALAAVTN
jgi:hypothetical protein